MNEANIPTERVAEERKAQGPAQGRTRTCVGCGERVDPSLPAATDVVRLVLGPGGEVCVDARSGSFGRGAHVHARATCLDRAAKGGLARSTKGRALAVLDEAGERHTLSARSLAWAIQSSMVRRIEGLFTSAIRSRQLARGADAVTGACQRGEAALVVVACDAAAAANLTAVRRAVSDGRAIAWGNKLELARMAELGRRATAAEGLSLGDEGHEVGVAVVAVSSRTIAEALRRAVQIAGACAAVTAAKDEPRLPKAERPAGSRRSTKSLDRQGRARRSASLLNGKACERSSQRGRSGVRTNVERGA